MWAGSFEEGAGTFMASVHSQRRLRRRSDAPVGGGSLAEESVRFLIRPSPDHPPLCPRTRSPSHPFSFFGRHPLSPPIPSDATPPPAPWQWRV